MPRARDGPAREQRSSEEERKNGGRRNDKRKVAPRLLRAVGCLLEYIGVCRGRYGTGCAPRHECTPRTCVVSATRIYMDRRTIAVRYTIQRALSGNSPSYMYIYNIIVDTDLFSSEKRKKPRIKVEGTGERTRNARRFSSTGNAQTTVKPTSLSFSLR